MNKLKILIWNIKEIFRISNFRRDKSSVLFGAWFGEKFADNPRFLFQYLSDNKEKLGLTHVVWVTRNEQVCRTLNKMGYESYMMDSEKSIYYHRTAGVHIICNGANDDFSDPHADILGRYSTGAVKINLWHGLCGIKGFGFLSNEYIEFKKYHPFKAWLKESIHRIGILRKLIVSPGGWGDCYFLSTTPYVTMLFKKINLLPEKNFILSGYPRNCINIRLSDEEKKLISKLGAYKFKILYLPTFRDNSDDYSAPLECENVRKWLSENSDVLWIEKGHSADKLSMLSFDSSLSNVIRLDSNFEINILLPHTDILVSDYSSVIFEALYHNKPVMYYVPDLDYYKNHDRGFLNDPDFFMTGKRVYDGEQIVACLTEEKQHKGYVNNENYKQIKKQFWGAEKNIDLIWKDICQHCRIRNK